MSRYRICEKIIFMHTLPFITVDSVTVSQLGKTILSNISWNIKKHEQWIIVGPNGAGKTTLTKALLGAIPIQKGEVTHHFLKNPFENPKKYIGHVSFGLHENLMQKEKRIQDLLSYFGKNTKGTTVKKFLSSNAKHNQKLDKLTNQLHLSHLLSQSLSTLSTGEMRKVLILKALLKNPKLLILDEPFDGLDEESYQSLIAYINHLLAFDLQVVLIVQRLEEIPSRASHVLLLKNGKILFQGLKQEGLTNYFLNYLFDIQKPKSTQGILPKQNSKHIPDTLIEFKNVSVSYEKKPILHHINWKMRKGENWAILGPNGAGKSTMVKLITGENAQGFSNNITLFGKRKGSGESIWELKQYTGIVSTELQLQYHENISVTNVIASGFYDTVGLHTQPTRQQKALVKKWAKLFNISSLLNKNYKTLSSGQKRLVLITRAVVKNPILLILDEPCNGLDIRNRKAVLEIIEAIAATQTNLLYITHHRKEIPPCITRVLKLPEGKIKTI